MPENAKPGWWRHLARLGPLWSWVAGVGSAVLATVLGALVLAWAIPSDDEPSTSRPPAPSASATGDELPFTIAVKSYVPWGVGFIPDLPPDQVPPRPRDGDWEAWRRAASGVPAGELDVRFTIQGRSEAEVTLTGLRVRVVKRGPALPGTVYGPQGGDPSAFRSVRVDLDANPPKLTSFYNDSLIPGNAPEHERRPIRFPYTVSLSDAESFEVEGFARTCDCSWVIDLSWAAQGRTDTLVIDDDGKPFRVTGDANATRHCTTMEGNPEQCWT
jgi:hypothetical protein